jgi:hypothetical protein
MNNERLKILGGGAEIDSSTDILSKNLLTWQAA